MKKHEALEQIIKPIVEGFDCIFVGIELASSDKNTIIRVYADKDGGVSAEDCSNVSRQINAALSVEWSAESNYTLEVSSPGIDRKLFAIEQYVPQIGNVIKVRLLVPNLEGRRNFEGELKGVNNGIITLTVDNVDYDFEYSSIDMAKVVPQW